MMRKICQQCPYFGYGLKHFSPNIDHTQSKFMLEYNYRDHIFCPQKIELQPETTVALITQLLILPCHCLVVVSKDKNQFYSLSFARNCQG